MGSDETAMATTGGPRVIAYLTVTGCYRAQITYFFQMQIGSRTPSGMGLGSGSRLRRMRRCLGLSRELWIENFGGSWSKAMERQAPCLYVSTDGSARACGVGACPRLVPSRSDFRETSGPQIDRIPLARPTTWAARRRPRIKFFFSDPQEVSNRYLRTTNGPNASQTSPGRISHFLPRDHAGARRQTSETPARRRRDPRDN